LNAAGGGTKLAVPMLPGTKTGCPAARRIADERSEHLGDRAADRIGHLVRVRERDVRCRRSASSRRFGVIALTR
jgi:hypothetical protein